MAEIINLRGARKTRARQEAAQKAVENRAKFGRTKAEKAHDAANAERLNREIDGTKRD